MKPHRLSGGRMWAAACVLVVAGVSQAAAQFPPPPGQSQANPGGAFPPPPGAQQQSSPFPPPPGANQASQSSPFPPPPGPGGSSAPVGIRVTPSSQPGVAPPAPGGFGGGGFGGPPQQGPTEAQKVCLTFPSIREEVEKSGNAIKQASARKAAREEVCPLFKDFVVKEAKMLHFLSTNQKNCGVPPNIVSSLRTNHAKTVQMRNGVCSSGPVAGVPRLSDALGGPIIADDNSAGKPGRGTFDTLTGNALQR